MPFAVFCGTPAGQLLQELIHVVEADQDNDAHQPHEQPVHDGTADLCVDLPSYCASQQSAQNHADQEHR